MNMTGLLSAIALVTAAAAQEHGALAISNDLLELSYDPGAATFTLKAKGVDGLPAQHGRWGHAGDAAKVVTVSDPTFGAGQALTVTAADGRVDQVALYPGLPFALFGAKLVNPGANAVVLNRVDLFSLDVDLGVPTAAVRSLGTAGLELPDKQPGSYVYLALADPATRRGVVGAWLTHDRGSGTVFSTIAEGRVKLDPRLDYGRLRLKPGASADSERFASGYPGHFLYAAVRRHSGGLQRCRYIHRERGHSRRLQRPLRTRQLRDGRSDIAPGRRRSICGWHRDIDPGGACRHCGRSDLLLAMTHTVDDGAARLLRFACNDVAR